MKTIKPDTLSRRQLFPLLGGALALATVAPRSTIADSSNPFVRPPAAKARFVYVGTYTFPGTAPGGTHQSQATGIYVFRMNPSNGGLTLLQIAEISNPSYLALDPTLRHLYSVNEMTAGAVSAYVINQANGLLTPLNTLVPTNARILRILACNRRGSIYSQPVTPAATFRSFRSMATVRSAP